MLPAGRKVPDAGSYNSVLDATGKPDTVASPPAMRTLPFGSSAVVCVRAGAALGGGGGVARAVGGRGRGSGAGRLHAVLAWEVPQDVGERAAVGEARAGRAPRGRAVGLAIDPGRLSVLDV